MASSDLERSTLDCFEILKNNEYWMIESICISIRQYPKNYVDEFMVIHFLRSDELLTKISEQLSLSMSNDSLSAALLLILPFVNCSSKIEHKVCEKYLFDKRGNNQFCRGLVYALSRKLSLISLQTKLWIMCTLCNLIETKHNHRLSPKIKDGHGLVSYLLQILQCDDVKMLNHSDLFKIKQYAIRILLCELNEGVMARQHLKDEYTNLIILQTIIQLHEQYECIQMNAMQCDYDEYQWLMVKLLQFLYLSFNFDDLWLSFDDYRSQCIECQGLDIVHNDNANNEHAFNDNVKSHYLRLYLMTRCQFGRLLKIKCKLFLNSTKGIFIKVAIKLLLQYPLNDRYGLIEPVVYDQQHPLNKYHSKEYVENFDQNANQDIQSLHHHNNHHQHHAHNNAFHHQQHHQSSQNKKNSKKNHQKKSNKNKNKSKNAKNKNKHKQSNNNNNSRQKNGSDHKLDYKHKHSLHVIYALYFLHFLCRFYPSSLHRMEWNLPNTKAQKKKKFKDNRILDLIGSMSLKDYCEATPIGLRISLII